MNDRNHRDRLDELDWRIIAVLRSDGRASNREIAAKMKVSAATVSARIRRMEKMKALRIVALSDFAVEGFDTMIAVGVDVAGRSTEAVARDLAALDEVFGVHLVSGRHDIEMSLVLRGTGDLPALVRDKISRIPGISRLHAGVTLDVLKYEFDTLPLA